MIYSISIKNIALINEISIDFSDGFIDKIVLSPFMSTSDVKDLKRMLESIDQYAKVKESNITA